MGRSVSYPRAKSNDRKGSVQLDRAITRYAEINYNMRRFDTYDLMSDGILNPGPNISYFREIEGKKGPLFGLELEIEYRAGGRDPDDYEENDSSGSRGECHCDAEYSEDCECDLSDGRDGYDDEDPISRYAKRKLKEALKPMAGKYFVCSDGSLREGVEIVFAPMSAMAWMSSYTALHKTLQNLSKCGFISHQSGRCGLHVHVSRGDGVKGYTQSQAERAQSFLCTWEEFFKKISRREDYGYCHFSDGSTAKYSALNIARPDTVEYRFFRGTLIPSTFFAALETVFALTDYFVASRDTYSFPSFTKTLNRYKHAPIWAEMRLPGSTSPKWAAERQARIEAEAEERRQEILRSERTSRACREMDRFHEAFQQQITSAQLAISGSPYRALEAQFPLPIGLPPSVVSYWNGCCRAFGGCNRPCTWLTLDRARNIVMTETRTDGVYDPRGAVSDPYIVGNAGDAIDLLVARVNAIMSGGDRPEGLYDFRSVTTNPPIVAPSMDHYAEVTIDDSVPF